MINIWLVYSDCLKTIARQNQTTFRIWMGLKTKVKDFTIRFTCEKKGNVTCSHKSAHVWEGTFFLVICLSDFGKPRPPNTVPVLYNSKLLYSPILYTPYSILFALYSSPITLHSLRFTLYSILFTLHSLLFTLYSSLFTLYSSLITLYCLLFTLYFFSFLFTLYSLLITLYCVLFTVYSSLFTLYSLLFTLHSFLFTTLHSSLITLQSLLHTLYSLLFTVYSSLITLQSLLLTLYSALSTLYSWLLTLFALPHTPYSILYILDTLCSILCFFFYYPGALLSSRPFYLTLLHSNLHQEFLKQKPPSVWIENYINNLFFVEGSSAWLASLVALELFCCAARCAAWETLLRVIFEQQHKVDLTTA